MGSHEWWHLAVLGSTLFGAAGIALLALVPLVFDEPPQGFQQSKPFIAGAVALAALLLLVEWLGVH